MMGIIATAATFIVLTLTSLMGATVGQTSTYVAQPDCSSLQPAPCRIIPSLDDNDRVTYGDYEESCPNHICYAIQPVFPAVSNTSSMFMSMIRDQRLSEVIPRGSPGGRKHHAAAERSSTAFTRTSDSTEKVAFSMVYDSSAPWFCSVANINYSARVEANTGYPPGKKEDMFAQCQYEQLLDTQSLGDCRHMRFSCLDCALYYQYWLCAMAFPQCDPSKTVTNYPAYNAFDPNSTGPNGLIPTKIFSIIKPCRGICWAVVQRCQQYPNFNCPLSDTRDYGDYPQCNALGLDKGEEPIAKGIYW
jgi:hypothetical protein